MLCAQCKKNQATKTYEQVKSGGKITEYYCLDCYHRLFLCQQETEGDITLSVCPYCGTTAEEFKATNMVGCAYCYQMLEKTIWSAVVKMQGKKAHMGKCPSFAEGFEDVVAHENGKILAAKQTKYQRQCRELEMVIDRLKKDGNFDGAKNYEEKLARMQEKGEIEEDFVWREDLITTK